MITRVHNLLEISVGVAIRTGKLNIEYRRRSLLCRFFGFARLCKLDLQDSYFLEKDFTKSYLSTWKGGVSHGQPSPLPQVTNRQGEECLIIIGVTTSECQVLHSY